ncbi:MAG: hypothetical protein ABIK21_09240 [bacterium]
MLNNRYLNSVIITIVTFSGISSAATIYSENFENSLGTEWATYQSDSSYGRNERSTYSANSGNYSWRMDVKTSWGYNLNELILHINTTAYKNLYLNFSTIEYGDEAETMSSSFSGHENSDGIAVSTDGTNWVKLWQYPSSVYNWTQYGPLYISSAISIIGDVYIKFQQYDNFSITTDGILWDDIEICATSISEISGYVLFSNGSGISDVLVELTGDATGQYTTAIEGYYNFDVSTGNYSYEVTPSKTGWSFSPASRIYTAFSETQTNQNFIGIYGNLLTGMNYFKPVNNLFDPTKNEKCIMYYNIISGGKVCIQLYTITGALVKTLIDEYVSSGTNYVVWDGRNNHNQIVSSGIYLAFIDGPGIRKTKKICVVK